MMNLTPEMLAAIAGAILSLAFSYIPGLNTAFAGLKQEVKRLIMAGLLLVVAGAVFGLSCAKILEGVSCDQAGVIKLVTVFLTAVMANQSAYQLTPLPDSVRTAAANSRR